MTALPGTSKSAVTLTITGLSSVNSLATWDSSKISSSLPTCMQTIESSLGCSQPRTIVSFFEVKSSLIALMLSARVEFIEPSGIVLIASATPWFKTSWSGESLRSSVLGIRWSSSLSDESNRLPFCLPASTVSNPSYSLAGFLGLGV